MIDVILLQNFKSAVSIIQTHRINTESIEQITKIAQSTET